jgi:hypothetical protein
MTMILISRSGFEAKRRNEYVNWALPSRLLDCKEEYEEEMFEETGETPEQRRERLRRQRKEFLDYVYRDLEQFWRQRPP